MKKLLAAFLALSLATSVTCGCAAQETAQRTAAADIVLTIGQPEMLVNGVEQSIDEQGTAPVVLNGRTLLPVRAAVEAMGGAVEWDGDSETVTLSRNETVIHLMIGSETAYLNGTVQTLDAAPVMIRGRTMLPIRLIAESFGYQVQWDEAERRVTLSAGTAEPSPPADAPDDPDENQVTVTVNGQQFALTLEENETAEAFYEMLPLTLTMDEMNGNEKYHYLDQTLPDNSRRVDQIHAGDLMLYGANCIVSFFETFPTSYSYTRIGHIRDAQRYAEALPPGEVTVTFSKQ